MSFCPLNIHRLKNKWNYKYFGKWYCPVDSISIPSISFVSLSLSVYVYALKKTRKERKKKSFCELEFSANSKLFSHGQENFLCAMNLTPTKNSPVSPRRRGGSRRSNFGVPMTTPLLRWKLEERHGSRGRNRVQFQARKLAADLWQLHYEEISGGGRRESQV